MKKAILCILFLAAPPTGAQIDVRIVDYPSRVQMYDPIVVTAEVKNLGAEGLLIPSTGLTDSSYSVWYGRAPDALSLYRPYRIEGGGSVIWLEAGETWLFQINLGRH